MPARANSTVRPRRGFPFVATVVARPVKDVATLAVATSGSGGGPTVVCSASTSSPSVFSRRYIMVSASSETSSSPAFSLCSCRAGGGGVAGSGPACTCWRKSLALAQRSTLFFLSATSMARRRWGGMSGRRSASEGSSSCFWR